jgi:hypothetical protein
MRRLLTVFFLSASDGDAVEAEEKFVGLREVVESEAELVVVALLGGWSAWTIVLKILLALAVVFEEPRMSSCQS